MRGFRLVLCFLILNCSQERQLDIQGHRGARGLMPENTIPAFEKAMDLGVTTLELDVVISKDHQVVVSHEPFMNHLTTSDVDGNIISEDTEKSYNIYTMNYDSIRLYDCGSKRHPDFPSQDKIEVSKPLLSDVVDMAEARSNKTIKYNIEIKSKPEFDGTYSPQVETYVDLVIELIKSKGITSRSTLQSFDTRALELIFSKTRRVEMALLVDDNESISDKLSDLSFKPDVISPYYKLLNQQTVSELHKRGIKVIPWTVNEISDMNLMIDFNVDGIISDYPNRLIQLLSLKK